MEIRSFLIPTTATLSLSLTQGCGPAGWWHLDRVTADGVVYDYPLTEDQPYIGETTSDGFLQMKADLTGKFEWITEGVTSEYAMIAARLDTHEYVIHIENWPDLICAFEQRTMPCDVVGDEFEAVVVWERP